MERSSRAPSDAIVPGICFREARIARSVAAFANSWRRSVGQFQWSARSVATRRHPGYSELPGPGPCSRTASLLEDRASRASHEWTVARAARNHPAQKEQDELCPLFRTDYAVGS